jgi:hypothetical protein
MITLPERAAWAAFEVIHATLMGMIEDGDYTEAMEKLGGPTAEADRYDHMEYANGLVWAYNEMLSQFKPSHSIFGIRAAKMRPIDHTFTLLS